MIIPLDLLIIAAGVCAVPLVVGAWNLPGVLLRRRMTRRVRRLAR